MDLCTFSVVSVGGKEGLAGQTLDSFTSCIVGSSRTTYCLTTPTTLDHSPAPRMFNQFQWSLGADAEVSARSGPSAATSSSCSAGGRSGAPAPRPLLRIQLSASESAKWPRCSIVHGFRAVRNAAQRSPCGSMGRGVGLGSRTHGFLGVDHLLARAQVITVHSVIAGALFVCRCCICACHIGRRQTGNAP